MWSQNTIPLFCSYGVYSILYLWGVFEVINHFMARVHLNECHLEHDNIGMKLGL